METTERYEISLRGKGTYTDCILSEVELSHLGMTVDFAHVTMIDESTVSLGLTSLPRANCSGRFKFTVPGISGALSATLREVHYLTRK